MEAQHRTTTWVDNIENVFRTEGRYGSLGKWGLLGLSVVVLMLWRGLRFTDPDRSPEVAVVLAYGATTLLFTILFLPPRLWMRWHLPVLPVTLRRVLLFISYLLDYLYLSLLIALSGGFQSELYVLYGFLALKSAIYYPYAKELSLVSFLTGILWLAAAYFYAGSLSFIADRNFALRYGTLFLFVIGCLAIGWLMERRQKSISSLDADLSRKSEDLENQARLVQRTASELANRLLELRSLQEGFKAINSALALDELLQLIVENATQVLGGARCTIGLMDEQREAVVIAAAAGIPKNELWGTSFRIGQGVAGWVVEHRAPALIHAVQDDARFLPVGEWPISSLVCVPLLSDGEVIGALTATHPDPHTFSEADVSLLDAFGDQAAVAVKNARLYEQLVREEKETARLYQSVLEKSNELEAILRGIGDGVIVTDPQLRLMMMNPVAARIFGIYEAPQPGVRLPELISNEAVLGLLHDTLSDTGAPFIREITLPGETEQVQTYQALASAVRGADERVRGVVMVMRDITTQKEIEQTKSNFLSVVSHELRTPLHSIKGFVDIILMGKTGPISALQRDFLGTVKESTSSLQRLIDDLLEFSRMEAGRIKLKPDLISVFDIAEKVVEQLTPLAENGQLKLHNQIPESIDLVEADPMRIEQVLTNLVSNAIKFTPAEGSISISAQDLGEHIQVSVKDTGIGISEEEQERIFQRFYQVDGSATRAYRGAGLGLTICKFIIEYHHGRIWVESRVGQGSTFHFVLPKLLPKDEALVVDFTVPAARQR